VTICVVLGPKKSSTYSGEFTSGIFRACGLASGHTFFASPRYEGNVGQAPSRIIHDGSFRNGGVTRNKREEHNLRDV